MKTSLMNVFLLSGVRPGNLIVSLSNERSVNTSRTFSVEKEKVYTVLLVGVPGSTDSTKADQIKYITNGTVTPQGRFMK